MVGVVCWVPEVDGLSDLVGEAWCCGGEPEVEFVEEDEEAEADFER